MWVRALAFRPGWCFRCVQNVRIAIFVRLLLLLLLLHNVLIICSDSAEGRIRIYYLFTCNRLARAMEFCAIATVIVCFVPVKLVVDVYVFASKLHN